MKSKGRITHRKSSANLGDVVGRPKEGRRTSVRLTDDDVVFAQSLSDIGELADGLRIALDEARQARNLPIPQRTTRRIVTVAKRPLKKRK